MSTFPKTALFMGFIAAFNLYVGINATEDTLIGYANIAVGFIFLAIFGHEMSRWSSTRAETVEAEVSLDGIK